MQKVSKAYRDSMRSLLRERGYILLSFGLINREAQTHAAADRAESGAFAPFSRPESIFSQKNEDPVYATLEENFTRVDGSMRFFPRGGAGMPESERYLYDPGLVGNTLVSEAPFGLMIRIGRQVPGFRGLTVDFGENYPVRFTIESDGIETVEVENNGQAVYCNEELIFGETSFLKLTFYEMKQPKGRLRIRSLLFGYGIEYGNDSVLSSSLTGYVSPICEDLPQIDFTVQLTNYDRYFDFDNPRSAINFLETGQEMDIFYGYQLPDGEIEWIQGGHLLCSDWDADDYTATIRCQDVFRNMDSEYRGSSYEKNGYGEPVSTVLPTVTFYDLAERVLQDAGVTSYYIDPLLKNLTTRNPLPRVSHKQALQLISNACRCVLTQTRDGRVQIRSAFVPEAGISANGQAAYSDVEGILEETPKAEYGSFAANYTTVDGGMHFLPRYEESGLLQTGFVSEAISDENGEFSQPPMLTFRHKQGAVHKYYGLTLVFGNSLPAGITVRTFCEGNPVEVYVVEEHDAITGSMNILHEFDDFDTATVTFTKTAQPFNRIVVNRLCFGDDSGFTMTRTDMTSSPKATRLEQIRDVTVPYYSYLFDATEGLLTSEELVVEDSDEDDGVRTYYFAQPHHSYRVSFTGGSQTDDVKITSCGAYYLALEAVPGTYQVAIYGGSFRVTEQQEVRTLNDKGRSVKWENPLLSGKAMASDLADWLAEYYSAKVEYTYITRGNPELDANDIVHQENDFTDHMRVNLYRHTINFDRSFSGSVAARRKE